MKTIKAKVEVDTQEAGDKFTRLQTQIRETRTALQQASEAGDKVKFSQLKGTLDDLEDKLEVSTLKSKKFDDALAGLPGPAGAAGNAMKGLDGAFKLIVANPIVATIAGLTGLVLALVGSLKRTEEGTKALSRITEGFERILNGLFAILEPIAFAFADLIGSLLENQRVMKFLGTTVGIVAGTFNALFSIVKVLGNFVVNNFINAFKSLTGVLSGVGQVLEGVFTFDLDKIKAGVKQVGDTVVTGFEAAVDNVKTTASGLVTAVTDDFMAGFDAAEASFEAGTKRLTKKEREEKKKRDDQAAKDAEEAKKKREEALKEAEKVLLEAELSLLGERQRKLKEREIKFNEDKAALIAAGITDFTTLEKAYREDILDINKEYDEKDAAQRREANLARLQDQFETLERLRNENDYDFQADLERIAQQKELLRQQEEEELANTELTEAQRLEIKAKYSAARIALEKAETETAKAEAEFRRQVLLQQLDVAIQFGQLLQQVAGKSKGVAIAGIVIEKAASIAKIVANTAAGIAKLIPGLPVTAPAIAATKISGALGIASTIASAAKAISEINKAGSDAGVAGGGGGGGGGNAGGGSQAAAPAFSAGLTVGAPQIGATTAQTGTIAGIVAGAVNQNNSQTQPIRAYVVGNEVTTQQQLDRRISTAARLGG